MRIATLLMCLLFASPALAETVQTPDAIGCDSADAILRIRAYNLQHDGEAIRKFVMSKPMRGRCVRIPQGQEVLVMAEDLPTMLVRVRRHGQIKEWWVEMLDVMTLDEAKARVGKAVAR